jgi:acyl-CoA thioesterase I
LKCEKATLGHYVTIGPTIFQIPAFSLEIGASPTGNPRRIPAEPDAKTPDLGYQNIDHTARQAGIAIMKWQAMRNDNTSTLFRRNCSTRNHLAVIIPLALMVVLGGFVPLPALAQGSESTEQCLAANADLSLRASLPRSKARVTSRQNLVIVAIGSSSTRGVGASSWAASYPEVMQRELERLRPGTNVTIINKGVNGETIPGQLARFETDVLAHQPALVIWQLGANDVVMPWGGMPEGLDTQVVTGIRQINAAGADVILMDMQRTPFITGASQTPAMLELIQRATSQTGAGHFPRFAMFGKAERAGVNLSHFTSWDGLHNTDAGYDCTGRALARAMHVALK